MSQDRLHQIRRCFADGASQDDESSDLGPLRALATAEELGGPALVGPAAAVPPGLGLSGRSAGWAGRSVSS
jgi:hypothetical protein